jgi:hypothetical protein
MDQNYTLIFLFSKTLKHLKQRAGLGIPWGSAMITTKDGVNGGRKHVIDYVLTKTMEAKCLL